MFACVIFLRIYITTSNEIFGRFFSRRFHLLIKHDLLQFYCLCSYNTLENSSLVTLLMEAVLPRAVLFPLAAFLCLKLLSPLLAAKEKHSDCYGPQADASFPTIPDPFQLNHHGSPLMAPLDPAFSDSLMGIWV